MNLDICWSLDWILLGILFFGYNDKTENTFKLYAVTLIIEYI